MNASGTVRSAPRTVRNASRTVRSGKTTVRNAGFTTEKPLDSGPFFFVSFRKEDTMTQEDYDERRRALEEQLRADIALLQAAHEVRVRALDTLWQGAKEGNVSIPAPPPSAAVREAVPAMAAPPVPARPRGAVLDDLANALPRLPNVFDKRDIARVLGYTPSRSTLFRALERLIDEGAIAVEDASDGGLLTLYRKVHRAVGSPGSNG